MYTKLFYTLLNAEFITAGIIFIFLIFITAPYGRFERKGWGPVINSRSAWLFMEMPAFLVPLIFFINSSFSIVSAVFLIIWQSHYLHRSLIYPFQLTDPKKPFSLIIVLWGFVFNLMNSYINFYYLFRLRPLENTSWLISWQFIAGLFLFILGYIVNKYSDGILRSLRKGNSTGYSIPEKGLFRWISAPNYLGEILEWCGLALLTWSIVGLAFLVFTLANLVPRAVKIHKWYLNYFKNYPKERKAIIPYLL